MKKVIAILLLMSICTMASAVDITITVPNNKVPQLKTSLFWYGQSMGLTQGEDEGDLVYAKRIIRNFLLSF